MPMRTATHVLDASGSVDLAPTVAPSTVPPAQLALIAVVPAVKLLMVTVQVPSAAVVQALPSVVSLAGGPASQSGLTRSVSTKAAVAPSSLVSPAVTHSPARPVHTPSATDCSRVMVSTWSLPTSLASSAGVIDSRTATHVLDASGSVDLAPTVAPSTVPPAQLASTLVVPAVKLLMVTVQVPSAAVVQALPSVVSLAGGPASQSGLTRSVSTKAAVAPSSLVSPAVTHSPARPVHTPSATDCSRVMVSTWSLPTSLASSAGVIDSRTATHVLDASGSVDLAPTVAPSTVPPAQLASTLVVPAVKLLMVTVQVPSAAVVQALPSVVSLAGGPASQSGLTRSVSTKAAVAPSSLVSPAVTHSPARPVHTPSATDCSRVMVSTWSLPTSLASSAGVIDSRTATHVLDASGSVDLAPTVAPSTVPPAQLASTLVVPAVKLLMVTVQVPSAAVVQALPSVVSLAGGPASQSGLTRSVSTKAAVAPSSLVSPAVTHSPARPVHTPSATDCSRVMVSTWSLPTSLASSAGVIDSRTATHVLDASGSVDLAPTVAPSTVPPAQLASTLVVPAVKLLMVTVQVPSAAVVQALPSVVSLAGGPASQSGLTRSVSTKAAVAPSSLVSPAVTHSPARPVHTPSATDCSRVMVSTWSLPTSLASSAGVIDSRTATHVLDASGSVDLAPTVAPSTVPPAQLALIAVVPAVKLLMVTVQVPSAAVVQALPSVVSLAGGPASQSGLTRSVSTKAAVAPSSLVSPAVTHSPARPVHTPSATDCSRVMVSTWSLPTSLASSAGVIDSRTATHVLDAAPVSAVVPVPRVIVTSAMPSALTSIGMLALAETTLVPATLDVSVTSQVCGDAPAGVEHVPGSRTPGPLSLVAVTEAPPVAMLPPWTVTVTVRSWAV